MLIPDGRSMRKSDGNARACVAIGAGLRNESLRKDDGHDRAFDGSLRKGDGGDTKI